ncbi:Spondin_N [Seminavis robusta]|uniref:Spondin_N n=1 Tax=Seminavis robusta TaxID=568900 RepID=A0A9N8DEV9_9STRA|nr:Spondin_N [Seminavis robusta]|eukprot:Sro110_g055000.1 Spondin_N (245) ;mRNA; f:87216-88029
MAQDSYTEVLRTPSNFATTSEAEYSCKFTNLWSEARHPNLYPGNAHWSPPVLGAHSNGYSMWAPGALASPGIESVAETGAVGTLLNEFVAANDLTGDIVTGDVTFNRVVNDQVLDNIIFSREHPYLSSISMIAPSPDWFTGFYDYDPRSDNGNSWAREFTLLTYPWDAGTEQGTGYRLGNSAESPHKVISQFTRETVPENGIFLSSTGNEVLPVASWCCTLVTNVMTPSGPRVGGPNPDNMDFP